MRVRIPIELPSQRCLSSRVIQDTRRREQNGKWNWYFCQVTKQPFCRCPWRNPREAPPPQLPLGLRQLRRTGLLCQPRGTTNTKGNQVFRCEKGLQREALGRRGRERETAPERLSSSDERIEADALRSPMASSAAGLFRRSRLARGSWRVLQYLDALP